MRAFGGRLILLAVCLGAVAVPAAGAYLVGFNPSVAALVCAGAALLALTWFKPWWFWEDGEIGALRELVGDRIVSAIYGALGIGLLLFALTFDRA